MSIQKKISILFVTSLVMMGLIAFWVETNSVQKARTIQKNSYLSDAKKLFVYLAEGKQSDLNRSLKELGLQRVTDVKGMQNAHSVLTQPHTFGMLKIVRYSGQYYLYIEYFNQKMFLYDTAQQESINERYITRLLVLLDVVLMVVIYLVILKMLAPLKNISRSMQNFSQGDLRIRTEVDSKDEIGDVSKSFNEMADRLERTIKAREELLRDVGHELRTPIAKGKFALEGIADSKEKMILTQALKDLDELTTQILQMQMLENADALRIEQFKVQTLVAEAFSKLYIEKESDIEVRLHQDFVIKGDLFYLTLALKNLLDNALKYSAVRPIILEAKEGSISVMSEGKRLEKEFEFYLQAFTQNSRLKQGFGLGLSIVYKIVQKHGFYFEYEYKEKKNIFRILCVA